MVARIPLIVNPDAAQIQELPATDTIDFPVAALTADGTIAANTPVLLTSAGKVKAISTVAASSGSSTIWQADSSSEAVYRLHGGTFMSGLGSSGPGGAALADNTVIAAWQIKSTTSSLDQRLQVQAGILSGNSVTWGTRVNVDETTPHAAIASNGNNLGILMYDLGSAVRVRTFYVANGGTNIVLGNLINLRADSSDGSICYLGDEGGSSYFAVAYKSTSGSQNDTYVRIIKHDGHNNLTVGNIQYVISANEGATSNAHTTTHLIPISHNKFIVQVGQQSSNTTMNVCTRGAFGNSNGTDILVGPSYTSQQLGRSADPVHLHDEHYNGSAYDPINKKFIIWHNKGNGEEGAVRVYDIVGNGINFRFESNFVYDGVEHTHHSMYPTVEVTDIGQIVVTFNRDTNNHGKRLVGSYNHDRTRIYFEIDGSTSNASGATTWSSEDTRYVQQVKADGGKIINLYSAGSDGGSYNTPGKSIVFQTATTTLTADNFLGFSSAGYSDGDAARIKVVGNIVTVSQSLTVGEKYYVRDNGVLNTSDRFHDRNFKDVLAGIAIAATKLLITPV